MVNVNDPSVCQRLANVFCQKKTLIVLSSTALKFFQSLLEVFQLFSSAFTKSARGRKFNKEKTISQGKFHDDDEDIIAHNEVFEAPLESPYDVIQSLASSLRMKGKSIRLRKGDNSISFYLEDKEVVKEDLQ